MTQQNLLNMLFMTDLSITNVGLVLTVCLLAKEIIHFTNDTEKKIFGLLCSFLEFLLVSYTWVHA